MIDRKIISAIEKKLPPCCFIAGSYRRGLAKSNDVDIITLKNIDKFLEIFSAAIPGDYKIISKGEKKCSILKKYSAKLDIQYDIFSSTKKELPFMLLYATGSKNFNIFIRGRARKLGYKLNQYGLFESSGKEIILKSERDIFKKLKIKYFEPGDRNW